MDMNVGDADRVEELAEIAAAFLAELGGQRGLVVHGDEDHAGHVTQAFFGLQYEEIDALVFEFFELAERSPILFEGERYGRFYLVAPLRDPSGDCLGMLYADSRQRFGEAAFESMRNFAESYLATLVEICIQRPVPPLRPLKSKLN